jgi:hypothetical protein
MHRPVTLPRVCAAAVGVKLFKNSCAHKASGGYFTKELPQCKFGGDLRPVHLPEDTKPTPTCIKCMAGLPKTASSSPIFSP